MTETTEVPSLLNRVARAGRPHHDGGGCWVCRLPADVRQQLDAGKVGRVATYNQMLDWLVEDLGYDEATFGRLHYHFQRRHHLDEARP